jgi:hypothetical protein
MSVAPYREERTEAAIKRSVGDYLKTKPRAVRDGWRFGLLIIYSGVNVDRSTYGHMAAPKPLPAAAEAELSDTLETIADLVDGLLNPPFVATPRAFVVQAVAIDDKNLGLALTNAADDETFSGLLDALADVGAPRVALQ